MLHETAFLTHHIIKLPWCHLYVCVERRFQLYHALPKINLYVDNCLESWFKPYFFRMEKNHHNPPPPPFSNPPPFFLACQNFGKVGHPPPPLTKIPRSAPVIYDWIMCCSRGYLCYIINKHISFKSIYRISYTGECQLTKKRHKWMKHTLS